MAKACAHLICTSLFFGGLIWGLTGGAAGAVAGTVMYTTATFLTAQRYISMFQLMYYALICLRAHLSGEKVEEYEDVILGGVKEAYRIQDWATVEWIYRAFQPISFLKKIMNRVINFDDKYLWLLIADELMSVLYEIREIELSPASISSMVEKTYLLFESDALRSVREGRELALDVKEDITGPQTPPTLEDRIANAINSDHVRQGLKNEIKKLFNDYSDKSKREEETMLLHAQLNKALQIADKGRKNTHKFQVRDVEKPENVKKDEVEGLEGAVFVPTVNLALSCAAMYTPFREGIEQRIHQGRGRRCQPGNLKLN